MGVQATVVFADLTDSTAFFEALGNEKATTAITRLTQWIGEVCEAHHGRVVKKLGDGVLAVFDRAVDATDAVIQMQRGHRLRLEKWPAVIRMEIKAGVARGDVVVVDGDCYGDAVNVASRLSDLSGANQIWVTESVVSEIDDGQGLRFRSLGPVMLRGKTEPLPLYKVEWEDDVASDFLTQQAVLSRVEPDNSSSSTIRLEHLDFLLSFGAAEMPIHLGRVDHAELIVNDPRVSRLHARIEWRNGSFMLVDLSSFGTWVRFAGSDSDIALRRDECQLHGSGEIAMGVPFGDLSAPTASFSISSGTTQP
ncbi:adenylate/guanylate cyclase domain-containing protein [Pseudorhodoferax sp. Leaf267]|uniref:adenylate/guanylate cyclase domain-containing protein n=1 Tax=Pseudorhodoferax sp. Leaf267 TaxID=1736316 RepID=UPI0006FADF4E|nr:adenylate/guanylate cyclase domain-containing protein [Pseudorhodoferax sp. Leaf267]KQP14756.1 adenylate cyclase [Pseudorhodoferax sp. Leaf267]